MKKAYIVYCSPAGTTGHVAGVIADALRAKSTMVSVFDVGSGKDPKAFMGVLKVSAPDDCLFVGSPVYRDMAIYPVMTFLKDMPALEGRTAVPFVTWGGALSGIALWQMGKALQDKGLTLVGAAKVLAVHSLLYAADNPVGTGHPDASDDQQLRLLVDTVVRRTTAEPGTVTLGTLDYQPQEIGAGIKSRLGQSWQIIPKSVDENACTQCGTCVEVCPVTAVALDPGPVFNDACFDCFNCIRECPEHAIAPAVSLSMIEKKIRERVETFNEKPPTRIFL